MSLAHLWHPFWRYKGAGFDGGQSCVCEPLDQFNLGRQGYRLLFILQSIAWPDFYDANVVGAASRG